MSSISYFDRAGRPLATIEWALLLEDEEYRRVALTRLDVDEVVVSTVWLGIVAPIGGCMYETALFRGGVGVPADMERWDTEAEALAGHEALVEAERRRAAEVRR